MKRLIRSFNEKIEIEKLHNLIRQEFIKNPNIEIYEIEQNEDIYWKWHSIYGQEEIDTRPSGNTLERIIQKIGKEFIIN